MNLKSFLGSKFFSMELYREENREFGMIIVFIYVLERRLSLFLDYGLLVQENFESEKSLFVVFRFKIFIGCFKQ